MIMMVESRRRFNYANQNTSETTFDDPVDGDFTMLRVNLIILISSLRRGGYESPTSSAAEQRCC